MELLTLPLLLAGTALLAAWRMLLSPRFDGHEVPLGATIGVAAGLGSLAPNTVCFGFLKQGSAGWYETLTEV